MNSAEVKIWNETQDRLMGFVLRYTKDKSLAEDIVHDVFIKVHDKLSQLREKDKISAWIFRIAKNAITDHFRRMAKTIQAADLDWNSDGVTLSDCLSLCLREMIATLPDKYREAIELSELREKSQVELSQILNISYSGLKSRVQRARQMLKEKMVAAYRIKVDAYGNPIACENPLPCGCN